MAAALLAALPDPVAEASLRKQYAREEYKRGRADGWNAGYLAALADAKRAQHQMVADLELELARWHVCCRSCRASGHRDGCRECETRIRETFGEPHRDDHVPTTPTRLETAS